MTKYPMKLKFIFGSLALVLAGCASQTTADKPHAAAVSRVELYAAGPTFVADGVHVIRETSPVKSKDPATKAEVTPDKKAWDDFWGEVNRLELSSWKQKYDPQDTAKEHEFIHIFDGRFWNVKITTPQGVRESQGSNAYATIGQPRLTTLKSDSVDALYMAFEKLFASATAK